MGRIIQQWMPPVVTEPSQWLEEHIAQQLPVQEASMCGTGRGMEHQLVLVASWLSGEFLLLAVWLK